MTREIIQVKGVFKGLYEWGTGWIANPYVWDKFWKDLKSERLFYWEVMCNDKKINLVQSIHGVSIYLHPMDFSCIMQMSGILSGTKDKMKDDSIFALEELNKLCSEIANKLGGEFELYTKIIDVPFYSVYDMDKMEAEYQQNNAKF